MPDHRFILPVFVAVILQQGCRQPVAAPPPAKTISYDHIEDLTYTLNAAFPFIHVHNLTYPFRLEPMATLAINGVQANSWIIHEHLGTHIDAPNHFAPGGMSVDQIRPEDLIVPVVVIDIREKAAADRDAVMSVDDILAFEKKYGRIPAKACVMMLSGWEKYVHDPRYAGTDSLNRMHFPGISPEAAFFLLNERAVAGLGVDVISIDPGRDDQFSTHKLLFSKGKWAVENVAHLARIPVTGATLLVGAPKVEGATGGIARIFALW